MDRQPLDNEKDSVWRFFPPLFSVEPRPRRPATASLPPAGVVCVYMHVAKRCVPNVPAFALAGNPPAEP